MRHFLPLLPLVMVTASFAGTPKMLNSCTVCHLVRTAAPGEEEQRPLAAICRSCHDGVTASNHDSADRERESRLPEEGEYQHVRLSWSMKARRSMELDDCVQCHNPHNPNPKHVKRETSDCRKCHQEY